MYSKRGGNVKMGNLKGIKHRKYNQEEKLRVVRRYYDEHISYAQLSREEGIAYSIICKWLHDYAAEGDDGLAPHQGKGNHYSAIHTSTSIDEIGRLKLQVAKLEADVARLKKGYLVKGSGLSKEYVTGNARIFKLSTNLKKNIP
jgi:transposase-like protein